MKSCNADDDCALCTVCRVDKEEQSNEELNVLLFPMGVRYNTSSTVTATACVLAAPSALYTSRCPVDVTWFPFDEQSCTLVFATAFGDRPLDLRPTSDNVRVRGDITGEWTVIGKAFSTSKIVKIGNLTTDCAVYARLTDNTGTGDSVV